MLHKDSDFGPPDFSEESFPDPRTVNMSGSAGEGASEEEAGGQANDFGNNLPARRQQARQSSKTPMLNKFGRDLTAIARSGEMDPLIGRSEEIERTLGVLMRRSKNNPVLVGEAGVGKTAIAEGLAQLFASEDAPLGMEDKRIVEIDLTGLVAGTQYRGEFEERLKKLVDELRATPNVIAFIDEIHTLVGAGASSGSMDAANILKPALARGEISVIGATTLDEFRKYFEKDAALDRRFQKVDVPEPSADEAAAIISGLIPKYAEHHKVEVDPAVAEHAVKMSQRYIPDRFLPDKAIDLLDEACARVRVAAETEEKRYIREELEALGQELEAVQEEKQQYLMAGTIEEVDSCIDEEQAVERRIAELDKELADMPVPQVGIEDINIATAQASGVPVQQLSKDDRERLIGIRAFLKSQVVGQDHVVEPVAARVLRSAAGLADPNRPNGVFAFLGPTGVGKTELSKSLARFLFDNEDAMIRLDMSEYMEPHSVSKLVGSPPGYIGHEEGGQLTEAVRRKPYSIVLLDEIEKAHPKVFDMLLQMFEEGRLTDSLGRKIDFSNTYIIMTSNIGAESYSSGGIGFSKREPEADFSAQQGQVLSAMEQVFRPELVNRIDETLVFKQLDKEAVRSIVDIELEKFATRAKQSNLKLRLSFDQSIRDFIAEKGYNPEYGARPLRRAISQYIEDPLSEAILSSRFEDEAIVRVSFDGEEVNFAEKPKMRLDAKGNLKPMKHRPKSYGQGSSDGDFATAS